VLVLVVRKVSLTASQYAIAIAGVCNETEIDCCCRKLKVTGYFLRSNCNQ